MQLASRIPNNKKHMTRVNRRSISGVSESHQPRHCGVKAITMKTPSLPSGERSAEKVLKRGLQITSNLEATKMIKLFILNDCKLKSWICPCRILKS